jgi:dihydrofolate reductase
MSISIVVAMSKNHVIGVHNQLPWHLPADLRHFKNVTMGKPIVMGRKTFESIGKALPGRDNIVLTRDKQYQAEGCWTIHDEKAIFEKYSPQDDIAIIGGAQIFAQFLPIADKLYLTYVDVELDGDAFFPAFDLSEWQEIERVEFLADEKNKYNCTFCTLERIRKK